MVTIKMDGHKNVLGVKIDPEVAGDVEMLQDMMIAAAFNEAAKEGGRGIQRQNGRDAGWDGSAAWTVISTIDARFRRAARSPDYGIQTASRHRPEVGAAHRFPHSATRQPRQRADIFRRPSSM